MQIRRRCFRVIISKLMVVLVLGIALPATCLSQDAATSTRLIVRSKQGEPIANADVRIQIISREEGADRNTFELNDYQTNEKGEVPFELASTANALKVWVAAKGFVPAFADWRARELTIDRRPTEISVELLPGAEIGGTVVDEQGKPVAGVQVQVRIEDVIPLHDRFVVGSFLAEEDQVVTDKNGRWSLDYAPDKPGLQFFIGLSHPDYVQIPYLSRGEETTPSFVLEELATKSATITLEAGVKLKGQVVDPQGRPVKNGNIVFGEGRGRTPGSDIYELDPQGRFELPPKRAGSLRLTAIVPGFAPNTQLIDAKNGLDPIQIKLEPGQTTRIRVLDETGKPIQGAMAAIKTWGKIESVLVNSHPQTKTLGIPIVTDDSGLFEWNWAPKDEIAYSIVKQGYEVIRNLRLKPSDETFVVRLKPTLSFTGSVVNGESGQPLRDFLVIPMNSRKYRDSEKVTEDSRTRAISGRNGRFRARISPSSGQYFETKKYGVKIESSDFEPWISQLVPMGGQIDLGEIRLKPKRWFNVKITLDDGKPAAGIKLRGASSEHRQWIRSYTNQDRDPDGHLTAIADQNGIAKIPPINGRVRLIAFDDRGYAEELSANSDEELKLRLQDWASLKGQIYDLNGQPARDVRVKFEGVRVGPFVQDGAVVTTDADGRFEFTQLPPIRGIIRNLSFSGDSKSQVAGFSLPVKLEPGEVTTVEIGKGIKIRGQLVVESEADINVDWSASNLQIRPVAPPLHGWPKGLRDDEKSDWRKGFRVFEDSSIYRSQIDLGFFRGSLPIHSMRPSEDETFTIKVLEPGEYDLMVFIRARNEGNAGRTHGNAGRKIMRFKVDEAAAEAGQFDLGEVVVKVPEVPQLGERIENLEFRVGRDIFSIEDFQGKYVLLDFWYPGCDVCQEDFDQLAQFAGSVSSDDFAVLSLTPGGGGDKYEREAWETNAWQIGFLRYDSEAIEKVNSLGIYSFPRYFVLDRMGKLIFRGDLDGAIEKLNQIKK